MKPIEVNILGQSYVLTCPEGGHENLLQAVSFVNSEMSSIRDAGRVKAREKIAVLAALNLAYQLVEARSDTSNTAMQNPHPDALYQQPSQNFASYSSDNYFSNNNNEVMGLNGIDVSGLIEKIDSTLAHQPAQFF
jgi:cell division protein ZapA